MVGAVGALAAGCSGDDDNTGTTPTKDSGKDSTATTDGPVADTSTDTGPKDAGPPHAKLILVHGSPDVPAIRVCFGTGKLADGSDTTVQPLPALPDKAGTLPDGGSTPPGLYPGTGGPFPDLTDLNDVAITAFVVLADKIAAETSTNPAEATCDQLVGPANKPCTGAKCLAATDYIPLPTIAAQTFTHGNTYLLSAIGCLPGETGRGVGMCGAGYNPATGNVHVQIDQLGTTFIGADGGAGAQFAIDRRHLRERSAQGSFQASSPSCPSSRWMPGWSTRVTQVTCLTPGMPGMPMLRCRSTRGRRRKRFSCRLQGKRNTPTPRRRPRTQRSKTTKSRSSG